MQIRRSTLTRLQKSKLLDRIAELIETDLDTDGFWETAKSVGAEDKQQVRRFIEAEVLKVAKRAHKLRVTML